MKKWGGIYDVSNPTVAANKSDQEEHFIIVHFTFLLLYVQMKFLEFYFCFCFYMKDTK